MEIAFGKSLISSTLTSTTKMRRKGFSEVEATAGRERKMSLQKKATKTMKTMKHPRNLFPKKEMSLRTEVEVQVEENFHLLTDLFLHSLIVKMSLLSSKRDSLTTNLPKTLTLRCSVMNLTR